MITLYLLLVFLHLVGSRAATIAVALEDRMLGKKRDVWEVIMIVLFWPLVTVWKF